MNKKQILKQVLISILCFFVFSSFVFTEEIVTSSTTQMIDDLYRVSSDVTITERITVSGNVILYLNPGCTLTASQGLYVRNGNTLTIEGDGNLVANGPSEIGAVIGSNAYGSGSGEITINGGNITLNPSSSGACIGIAGDGISADGAGKITINGGHLIAESSGRGACLGGVNASWAGSYGGASQIIITGGIVDLTGSGNCKYCIGGASNGGYDAVRISGGQVTLTNKGIGGANAGERLIQLGWTDKDDFIQSPSYTYNKLEFLNVFRLDGKVTYENAEIATESNIAGKKIIPWVEQTVKYYYANNPIDVLFNSGNSQVISKESVALYKGLVTKPVDPVKTGYTFEGWYADRSISTPWDFENDIVTGDMTIYAKFVPQSIKVFTDRYYTYTGNEITVTPKVCTFDEETFLTEQKDYTYVIKFGGESVEQVKDKGTYQVEITGCGVYEGLNCTEDFYVSDPPEDPNDNPNLGPDPASDIITGSLSWDSDGSYYINMNNDTKIVSLDLSAQLKGFSFKVYDDGGKGGSYYSDSQANFTNNARGYLLVTVDPEYLIQISGIVGTKTKYDFLSVYDGSTIQDKPLYEQIHGKNNLNEYRVNLSPVNTSSNMVLLYFKGTSSNCEGLDLTLTIVNKKVLEAQKDLYTDGVYYTSFYNEEENFMADSDTTVYYAVKKSNGTLELCPAPGNVILKANGVVLKSSKPQITLYATNNTANYTSVLTGTTSDVEDTADLGIIYTLGISAKGGVGFYKYRGALVSGKAYYKENDNE